MTKVPVADFCRKYNLNYSNTARFSKDGFIDEKYFVRRRELFYRVRNEAHDIYFFLNRHLSIWQICTLLAIVDGDRSENNIQSWNNFIHKVLFTNYAERPITIDVMSPNLYTCWRYFRWIKKALFSKVVKVKKIRGKLEKELIG